MENGVTSGGSAHGLELYKKGLGGLGYIGGNSHSSVSVTRARKMRISRVIKTSLKLQGQVGQGVHTVPRRHVGLQGLGGARHSCGL